MEGEDSKFYYEVIIFIKNDVIPAAWFSGWNIISAQKNWKSILQPQISNKFNF